MEWWNWLIKKDSSRPLRRGEIKDIFISRLTHPLYLELKEKLQELYLCIAQVFLMTQYPGKRDDGGYGFEYWINCPYL